MTESERRTYAVVSTGLWRLRSDISQLLQARIVLWPWGGAGGVDGFVGWGRRPSGLRAMALASRLGKPAITIEDGFLKGFWPGQEEPSHSFVVDRRGIYFETMQPNDLDDLLRVPDIGPAEERRASSLIQSLRSQRLTKYNNGPMIGLRQAGIPAGKPFVLLVDQVAGDASIAAAGAQSETFAQMLEHAAAHNPGKAIVVRTHPAAGDRSLLRQAAQKSGITIVVPERMNPWPLIEEADSVYTVSSQLGFEALMAGRPVHCFGVTYYSGRGVTMDHGSRQMQRPAATVEQIFHAAFLRYSSYLDLHTRLPCTLEDAIEQAVAVRDQRNRIARKVYTVGFSPWKRRATTPFLRGAAGAPVHCRRATEAVKAAHRDNGVVAVWGSERQLPPGVDGVRLEDGFIRSKGLGVNLTYPSSLALDGEHVYYDARGESDLERIISTHEFEEALLTRSRDLVQLLVERGVSKYNLGTIAELPTVEEGRLKILVPGQVEQDASIRYGSPVVRSNAALVSAVRERYPDAFVVYKEHPDVTSGLRSGGQVPDAADIVVRSGDILQWIGWADRVETMTSLAGFEALLRGKATGVHGLPFYAGWGLTDDRLPIERRTRRITLDMLVAAALILYPFYIHPLSGMPCRPEEIVGAFSANRARKTSPGHAIVTFVAQRVNRVAVKLRDGRLK